MPCLIPQLPFPIQIVRGLPGRVVGVAAGACHSVALLEDGRVFGWGSSATGELGHARGAVPVTHAPTHIPALSINGASSRPAARVFAGCGRSFASFVPAFVTDAQLAASTLLPTVAAGTLSLVTPLPASEELVHTAAAAEAQPAPGAGAAVVAAPGAGAPAAPAAPAGVKVHIETLPPSLVLFLLSIWLHGPLVLR